MTAQPECSACMWLHRVIRREIRLQERRLRSGRIVDMTAVEQAKRDLAACAERGHHDPQAGPAARWREASTASP